MPKDDRNDTTDKSRARAKAPVQDLNPSTLDERTAKQVKGGTTASGGSSGKVSSTEFTIKKPVDRDSP